MQLRFSELVVTRPELDIRRDPQGKIYIAGLLFDAGGDSDARGADRRRGFEQALRALRLDAARSISIDHAPVSMTDGAQGIVALAHRNDIGGGDPRAVRHGA